MRLTKVLVVLMASSMLSGGTTNAEIRTPKVPQNVDGWTLSGEPQIYGRENLFDYINGGAELYLAYAFQRLFAYRLVSKGKPDIIVDVFDMGNANDAFGVFSAEREGPEVGIGEGSEFEGGLLRFWKGRYFISIVALGDSPRSGEAVRVLAAAIARGIHQSGALPALVELLPPEGLLRETVKYFRSHHLLNMHYYVASENILALSPDTDAVLARYDEGDGRSCLLLVHYQSPVHSEWARGHFEEAYMPDAIAHTVKTEDGRWTATELYGGLLSVVFDAPSQLAAKTLLQRVGKQGG